MPNVESTAVNELVDLAHQTPLDEVDDNLFGAPKGRRGLFELPPAPPAPIAPPAALAPVSLPFDEPAPEVRSRRAAWRRLAVPAAAVLALAVGSGVAVAHFAHGGAAPAVAQTKPIIVEPVAPPAVLAPAPAPKLVDVRLESTPPGATATLLSDGTATPLGATPVVASVDPSKRYDVVFATQGQPSQVVHLDPSTTHDLQVAFAPPAPVADLAPAPVAAPAPAAPVAAIATNKRKHTGSTAKARHHHHASRVASAKRAIAPKLADPAF